MTARTLSLRHLGTAALLVTGLLALACGDDENGANGNGNGNGNGTVVATTTVDVTGVFEPGAQLRDAYSGRSLTVGDDGRVEVPLGETKVALLERDGAEPTPFSWDSATVYFMMTDRFENGDPTNDDNFGRLERTGPDQSAGTWHGGDFAGIVDRLDYLDDLGVDALWVTPPVEQIHGWVGGGNTGRAFQHFPFHGYWALDFTKLDPNYGTEEDLRELVSEAHARGIRIVFDMVMNHPGYLTLTDAIEYVPEAVTDGVGPNWLPGPGDNWGTYNDLIDYTSEELREWWGPEWIRIGMFADEFPGHEKPGSTELRRAVGSLPDFRTERDVAVSPPPLFAEKADTNVTALPDATVRDYLVEWHTRWVREFGIDGFRADTAKHVELDSWSALKAEAVGALDAWKAENPEQALDDLDFWMVGEAFPPVSSRPAYFDNGFDALINFDFEGTANPAGSAADWVTDFDRRNDFYADLAATVSEPGHNELTYASSHDTTMFFGQTGGNVDLQFALAPALLFNPGAVQIYYGDESARPVGSGSAAFGDALLRSDMNWDDVQGERRDLVEHWQKIGQFRRAHRAVGAGAHAELTTEGDPAYAFSRVYDGDDVSDEVVVVLGE
jgi:alpha-amylase